MAIVNEDNISGLIQRTLNHVDPRLVDHGRRVAHLASRMLEFQGTHTPRERQELYFLALLHDVGAYKTEEIDHMLCFETENVWSHAIYGYLFLRDLSPLGEQATAVLFHHVEYRNFPAYGIVEGTVAQILHLADRVDLFWTHNTGNRAAVYAWLEQSRWSRFDPAVVDLFLAADKAYGMLDGPRMPDAAPVHVELTEGEIDVYLNMLISAIDFRSHYTVTHTVTTTHIAACIAALMGMDREASRAVYYGALLHDLGKIGIPVEILEFPGKLSAQAMNVMRTHVDLTEEILAGTVEERSTRIALRHHEKLDGSGYPRGLCGESLTTEERIVAVSDIVSALCGTRSYKESFPKEKTLRIINEMSAAGQLDPVVTTLLTDHFDEIMESVRVRCAPVWETYDRLNQEYAALAKTYGGTDCKVTGGRIP